MTEPLLRAGFWPFELSTADLEGASWTCMEPMMVSSSFGQNRAAPYDSTPSKFDICRDNQSDMTLWSLSDATHFCQRITDFIRLLSLELQRQCLCTRNDEGNDTGDD